ncbi:SMP-30/Gluconolaconase/LRE-like region [Geosmithia morbida]|uniref:SMP-30/Gluconolaconase/LRE-like region n=1 Tax=Geosmithia morbida TaxID=1094350 RepID=A0A9P4YPJ2_9HYPO|nr:SMP-30/Gluconolaconase/LRE-like region [Geosmithia morbida]KAF4119261.1 SMP-30/Gluconolaconase/LRE-like region [Geosmithia morbida]
MTLQEWKVETPWLEPHCALGEGPFFEKDTQTVRFVDIQKKRVHTVSLTEGPPSLQTTQLDVPVGVTCNIAGVDPRDRILIGVKGGLAVLDRKTGKYDIISRFTDEPNERLRANDGASDPNGRFWLGTMTDFPYGEFQPEGFLMRFDGKSAREEFISGLTIPNSVGWSPDNKTMYFTHTSAGHIYAFDYSVDTGAVTDKRIFYQHDGPGGLDGFRVDVDGNIWHAVYGEGRVIKISPGGDGVAKVVAQVTLPTRNITCVQFAGTELVITTAADDDGPDASKALGGAVYKVDVGTRGLELFDFKLQ